MGNENSVDINKTKKKSRSNEDDIDHLRQFYGRDDSCSKQSSAMRRHHTQSDDLKSYDSVFVTKQGLTLPYMHTNYPMLEPLSESDKITEIELIVCKPNGSNEMSEHYKVNSDTPNHDCGKNCYCIKKIIPSSHTTHDHSNLFESINENVQTIHKLMESQIRQPMQNKPTFDGLSSTSDMPIFMFKHGKNLSTTSDEFKPSNHHPVRDMLLSPDSDVPLKIKQHDFFIDNLSSTSEFMYRRPHHMSKHMPDSKPSMFSPTSDAFDNKLHQVNNSSTSPEMQGCPMKMGGGAKPKSRTRKYSTSSSSSSDEPKQSRSKHNTRIDTETSDNGLLLSNSSITTSDLYKMQSKIFGSDSMTGSASNEDSTSYTEKVNRAIDRMELHKNIFSSESKEILGLQSTSEKYHNKKPKQNDKYATKKSTKKTKSKK